MQFYNVFYRRFGLRIPAQLMTPVVVALEKFEFPKDSIYHFVAVDNVHYGPQSDDYLFRGLTKQILMDHVIELADNRGAPKKVSAQLLPYIREFHVKNRRFRYIKDVAAAARDENTLIVINYGFVLKAYRYMRSMYAEYYKWWNIQKTLWKSVAETAAESDRQQYIFANLPNVLPSVSLLKMYSGEFDQSVVRYMPDPDSLFILEIWKWLGEDSREKSVLNALPAKDYNKINIVYQDSGKWMMFNLGVINDWILFKDVERDTPQKIKIESQSIQRQFLRMLMSFMSYRTVPEESLIESDTIIQTPEVADKDNNPIEPVEVQVTNTSNILIEPTQDTTDTITADINEIDKDVIEETKLEKADRLLETMDEDLKELERIQANILIKEEQKTSEIKIKTFEDKTIDVLNIEKEKTPEENVLKYCDEMAEDGLITAAEYKSLVKASNTYKTIKSPFKEGQTLVDSAKITSEELKVDSTHIKDISTVIDKSMLKSSLIDFTEKYIKEVLPKDVASMVINVQKAGVILTNYEVEKIEDIMGDYEIHTMRVKPVQGTASNLIFKLPVVDSNGVFQSNGVKYTLRGQRGDLPIRKTAPDTVALTSYYGKAFVKRSSKKVNDYGSWLRNKIMVKGLDPLDIDITNPATGDFFDNTFSAPRIYSIISQGFRSFTCGNYHFIFDHKLREQQIAPAVIKEYEKDGMRVVGYTDSNNYLLIDKEDAIYETNGKNLELKGSIETLAKIDALMAPVDCSEIKIFGKTISVGLVLAYQMGLTKLVEFLKVSPRRVLAGQRLNLESNEYPIAFSDETWIFSKDDKVATMILAGLNEYVRPLKNYNVSTFDNPNVYYNILESSGINGRYLKEVDLMNDLFVDPITKELLIEMKEPTSFKGLLVRSSELLVTETHPDLMGMKYMRIKGYERLAGAAYAELIYAVREQKSKSTKNRSPIELHPYAVWKRIATDPSVTTVTDINPIADIKQKEAVTFSGTGGRSSRSMTKDARMFHQNDMGVISEATKDSSDVAINTYTSADPQFNSLRGTTKPYDFNKTGPTALLSTSALLSVASDKDDPKRVNFISIQHDHGIACQGYTQAPVRTGYEQVLAQRTSDMYAFAARQDGRIISRNEKGFVIEYVDGTRKGIELGRRFGQAGGLTIPHDVISDYNIGDTFKSGDVLCYNTGFFEKDILNPNNVVWKSGILVKTVLYESSQTLEDASSISKRLSEKLSTKTTKVKTLLVTFDQQVRNMINVGDHVEADTTLCIIEDAVTSNSNLFDEESLNTLKLLSGQSPAAKEKGIIDKIEVFYNGDKEDMSDSLRELVNRTDREMSKASRAFGKTPFTGRVSEAFRVDSEPLNMDSAAIRIYITSDVTMGIGDKSVFGNQMKSVVSEVMSHDMITENGEVIDAVFGQLSVDARVVNSINIMGTTNTLLREIGNRAVKLYKGN